MSTTDDIRKIAIQNALKYGRTDEKIVLGRLLGARPELRDRIAELREEISKIVSEVNLMDSMALRRQAEKYPDEPRKTITKAVRSSYQILPPLEGAERGKVVTRFPPEPNGYPHIGHAKAAIINSEYVDMYGGKKILRMDDTNPEAERLEFYAAIKVGLEWLGIQYDIVKNTSDDMETFYAMGEKLVKTGRAYVCTCKRDHIGKNRREMKACKCSMLDGNDTHDRWDRMFDKYKPGQAIARFRGDMQSQNTTMRDPAIFRIIEAKHPLRGNDYRVWPGYDLAVSVEDSLDGVTHAFRSKEYEMRTELYHAIQDALGLKKPRMNEFSRLDLEGMPVSKRALRSLIDAGHVRWYDDPRLPTLEGLKKRGIVPDAVRKFVLSLGLTKADTVAPFETLEAYNRKAVDNASIRMNIVTNAKRISVSGLPPTIELQNHPSGRLGTRTIRLGPHVHVEEENAPEPGERVWLLGLGNIDVDDTGGAAVFSQDKTMGQKRLQWVPAQTCKIRVLVPAPPFKNDKYNEKSMTEINAYTEPHYPNIKEGSMIQFIRFGYCRKDTESQVVFAHR